MALTIQNLSALHSHVDSLTKAECADLLFLSGRGSSRSYWERNHKIADLRATVKDLITDARRARGGEGPQRKAAKAWNGRAR